MGHLRIGKLQQCFTRTGKPKKRYETLEEARTAGHRHNQRWYQCEECDFYHLTSKGVKRARK